ncbi:MAG TPA: glycosyltransferase family 9 protein [Alphaproteobacteria bacterium]|nr:glycosyltransferase family 9 protein [Alphaproteobacteria bacterium]
MKILILSQLDLLGDGLLKIPFLKALKEQCPNAHITYRSTKDKTVYKDLLEGLIKNYVDVVIDAKPLEKGEKLAFDVVFDTRRKNFFELFRIKFFSKTCLISSAYGWIFSSKRPKNFKKPDLLLDKLFHLLEAYFNRPIKKDLSIEIPNVYLEKAQELLPDGQKYILLAPGAGGRYKCWPLEKFINTALALSNHGIKIAFLLGPQETSWQENLKQQVPGSVFPLQEAESYDPLLSLAIAQRCEALLANDAGTAHLIAPSQKPLVVLFGPTNEKKFVPNSSVVKVLTSKTYGSTQTADIPEKVVINTLMGCLNS